MPKLPKLWRAVCCKNFLRGDSQELLQRLQCFSFGRSGRTIFERLKCVILGRWKCVILGKLQYFSFRKIEMCRSQEIEMCHFREIKMYHFREIEISDLGDIVILQFSGASNLPFREIKLAIFEKLRCSFSGGLNMIFSGNWNVTFSRNEKIELSSFWKTESFVFFGKNHAHKKNWKSKAKTKSESKHTWGTTNADRIYHEIQPASYLLNKQLVRVNSQNFANWFEKYFPMDKNFDCVTVS